MEKYKVLIANQEYDFYGVVETELLTTQVEDKKFVLGIKCDFFTIHTNEQVPKLPDRFSEEKIKIFYKNQWYIAEWSFFRDELELKKSIELESRWLNYDIPKFYLHLRWEILNPIN